MKKVTTFLWFDDQAEEAARFYAKNVLPGIALARTLIEASDLDLMELPDDSW